MEARSIETIIRALNDHAVRYLIVGGLAVVAHGYVRFTADVDLLLAMPDANLRAAVSALEGLDYRPRAPVPMRQFLDPAVRRQWARDKGMTVFSLFSPRHPATEIDLFVEPPLDFEAACAKATQFEIAPDVFAAVCALEDLISMKVQAGRPRDLEDVRQLRAIHDRPTE